jgi:AcrR family transcriptional regulator
MAAALDAMAEDGTATARAIAERAGVSLPTLYRRWSSIEALLADALEDAIRQQAPLSDTGSLDGDLRARLQDLQRLMAGRLGAVLRAAIARTIANPEFAEQVARIHAVRRTEVTAMFDRARARGELAPDIDLDVLADLVVGVFWTRLLVTAGPITPELADQLHRLILRAVGPEGSIDPSEG